jgi:tRNA modification GTPase
MNFSKIKLSHFGNLGNSVRTCSSSTIFSLSSGKPKSGVAVIRVSGKSSEKAVKLLTGNVLPKPRFAALRKLVDPTSKELIDHGLVLWFPGPRSFTGEDSCEFQVHGGTAIISALLGALGKIEGLRPGTFEIFV